MIDYFEGVRNFFVSLIIVAILGVLAVLFFMGASDKHDDVLEVTGMKWYRTIDIEEYRQHYYSSSSSKRYKRNRTKLDYYQWDVVDTITTKGDKDTEFYWGEVNLQDGQREGNRSQRLEVKGIDSTGEERILYCSQEEWYLISIGDKISVEINGLGQVSDYSLTKSNVSSGSSISGSSVN